MTDIALTAGSFAELNADIQTADQDTISGHSYTITLTGSITETANLSALNLASGVNVTIEGADHTLNGASTWQGFFVYQGNVTIEDLTIQNAAAQGGCRWQRGWRRRRWRRSGRWSRRPVIARKGAKGNE